MNDIAPLPAGSRLLHIGIPKTGTTALQYAASQLRPQLLEHGVLYPGTDTYHFQAFYALIRAAEQGDTGRPLVAWNRLLREIDASAAERTFISSEGASQAGDAAIDTIREGLGADTYIAITLRGMAERLPSAWQQRVQRGAEVRELDAWLEVMLAERPDPDIPAYFFERNNRPADLAKRWASRFGADHVVIVMVDKRRPNLLYDSFEGLLGLPEGLLRDRAATDPNADLNRSMTPVEIEYVRRIREALRRYGFSSRDTYELVFEGAFTRDKIIRTPPAGEGRLAMPAWAAQRVAQMAVEQQRELQSSGVRIIGDPAILAGEVRTRDEPYAGADTVPMDLAVETVVGIVAKALGRDLTPG